MAAQTLIFSDAETESLAADFRLALIGKFSHGCPPYSQLHRLLAKSGIKGAFTVSMINNKHALISLYDESDYNRLWLRRIWYLNGFPMRVFKWTPTFTPEHESSIAPVWVSFPGLPTHLFRKDALFALANNIGTPLQIADSTHNKSNFSKARVCVEVDLLKPLLEEIDLKNVARQLCKKSSMSKFHNIAPYATILDIMIWSVTQKAMLQNPLDEVVRLLKAEKRGMSLPPFQLLLMRMPRGLNAVVDDVNTQHVVEPVDENDADVVARKC
ncbi:UNVERIFIED_CONTAM: hypothetical protein Sradi_0314700 [Sesamum radiatum]|uniref:DUF4283 domain-containing protein n=1 Tax=Sesamum radiatum TaxID=300843 RepID=A0AAW2W3T4_SESRA